MARPLVPAGPTPPASAMPRPSARLLVAAAAILSGPACGGGRPLPAAAMLPSRIAVEEGASEYTVTGTTARELADAMEALGPEGVGFRFDWELRWEYDRNALSGAASARGSGARNPCGIEAIRLTVILRRTLPSWNAPPGADPDLARRWGEFVDAVLRHGEGHRTVALDAARDIHRRLGRLESEDTRNCARLRREAEALVESLLDEYREVDRAYHEATGGGRTQGAVWAGAGGSG